MPQKTEALVLLPALLCDSRLYGAMLDVLKPEMPVLVPPVWQADSLAEFAQSLLVDLPEKFALVGNSMGGYLALEIMRQAADRVSHLALVGTNAHADLPEAMEKREQAIRLAQAGKFDTFVDGYVEAALFNGNRMACAPTVKAMARDLGAQALISGQTAIMARRSNEDILPAISVPVTVVCGKNDALGSPAAHREMAAAMPNATFHVIDRCGHLVPLEAPAALARQLDELLKL